LVREQAAKAYRSSLKPARSQKKAVIKQIRSALYASKICSYAQGFDLLRVASREFQYGLRLGELARIWKAGCIIRAVFLDKIRQAFERDPQLPNLLLDKEFLGDVRRRVDDWRATVGFGAKLGITPPAMAASLAYFDSFRRARLPAYLIQAQRDFFGAHTYERVGEEGKFVHTDWSKPAAKPTAPRR
jgi:6-phosphogluconate dehydrogenase